MTVSVLHVNDNQCRIVVNGKMTIDTVMELKDNLPFPLAKYNEMEIDLTDVSEIDSSGLQFCQDRSHAAGKILAYSQPRFCSVSASWFVRPERLF